MVGCGACHIHIMVYYTVPYRGKHSVPCLPWHCLSLVCTFSLPSRRWYWAVCDAMCCYALSNTGITPALSFVPLACRWAQNRRGIYVCVCVSERESDFPFLPLKHGCACAHGHMTAPWLWVCEDDKCGVVSHPGLSEHYLTHRRLYLTGHRPRQPASLGFSTYNPVATP